MKSTPRETRISRLVLRAHGTVLIIVTAALTVGGWIGYRSGEGQFGVLQEQPIGYVGLFQAYLLMTTLGAALWLGSFSTKPRQWHLVGIMAHAVPLAANLLFWNEIERHGISHSGIAVHLTLMSLELGGWLAARPTNVITPSAVASQR